MTPEQLAHEIENIIAYLRDLRKTRSLDFVLFRLNEIAAESEMTDTLKEAIKTCVENPEKEIKVKFKINKV